MKPRHFIPYVLLLLVTTPALAQIQGGPNIAPNGTRFTFSPRFGYLGPPAAFVPDPPPAPTPYYRPGSMPMYRYPRTEPLGAPPVRLNEHPGIPLRPEARVQRAPRPPVGRHRPDPPCPAGCPREPDDEAPIK